MGSEVKGDSVENSVIKIGELTDSTLEEVTKLKDRLESVLNPQDAKSEASDPKEPHGVKVINDLESAYDTLLDVRYNIRDLTDRLAL